jgi:YHS domain-containing protein
VKYLLAVIITIFLASCAHHHKTPEHHHHAFDKQCAYSVAHGNLKVEGNAKLKIEHGGKTYYFSSSKKMKEFKKNIEKNIKSANKNWSIRHEK